MICQFLSHHCRPNKVHRGEVSGKNDLFTCMSLEIYPVLHYTPDVVSFEMPNVYIATKSNCKRIYRQLH